MNYPISDQQMYTLSFEQFSEKVSANRSFLMYREKKDLHTNYYYKLDGCWVFNTEPSILWLEPPFESFRFDGSLLVVFEKENERKDELNIRPPYTTEKLNAPASISAHICLSQGEILQIAQTNRQGQALEFFIKVSLETETRGREVDLLGLVRDLTQGKPPEMPCKFQLTEWSIFSSRE
jgi:hypothetical protein